jgi:hypothetical protein
MKLFVACLVWLVGVCITGEEERNQQRIGGSEVE